MRTWIRVTTIRIRVTLVNWFNPLSYTAHVRLIFKSAPTTILVDWQYHWRTPREVLITWIHFNNEQCFSNASSRQRPSNTFESLDGRHLWIVDKLQFPSYRNTLSALVKLSVVHRSFAVRLCRHILSELKT